MTAVIGKNGVGKSTRVQNHAFIYWKDALKWQPASRKLAIPVDAEELSKSFARKGGPTSRFGSRYTIDSKATHARLPYELSIDEKQGRPLMSNRASASGKGVRGKGAVVLSQRFLGARLEG